MTTFQAVNRKPAPSIPQYVLGSSNPEATGLTLATRDEVMAQLKENLLKAHKRMKKRLNKQA